MQRIAIHSVPRSGSTWLAEIINSNEKVLYKYQPLFSYAFKNRLNEKSTKFEIDSFLNELAITSDYFLDKTQERKYGSSPIFVKDKSVEFLVYKEVRYHHILLNLLKQDENIILIGLIRNPLSVVNSWLRAPKEFKFELGWKELEEWRFANKKNLNRPEEFNGYEKWKEATNLFEELKSKYPKRVFLLRYDELLKNTEQEINNLFKFCNIEITLQTKDFINKSSNTDHSNNAYSVYRKNQLDDKWKTQLNSIIISEIKQDLKSSKLKKYLL